MRGQRAAGAAQSATRGASPGCASAYLAVSPMPMPQEPCRSWPLAASRARLAALVVGRGEQGVAVHGQPVEARPRTPAEARWAASAASASGSTSTKRDRWVRTPGAKLPEPNWAKVWCRPSAVTHVVRRLRAAVEPDHRAGRIRGGAGEQS